jgi:hypothetical protein
MTMKKSGLPIVLAIGLGCHHQAGICQQPVSLHYSAREIAHGIQPQGWLGLSRPVAVVCDESRVFVLDMDDGDIKVFSRSGVFEAVLGRKGQGPGEFSYPSGLDIRQGKLYVADSANRRVQVIDANGRYVSGFQTPFCPTRVLALRPDRIVVMSLPTGRQEKESVLHGFDGGGELLWEAGDSFFSRDSVTDLMRNRWFIVRAAGGEFLLVPGADGRTVRRFDSDGTLLEEAEVSDRYASQEVAIPAKDGGKRMLRTFCWNCASDKGRVFLIVPERMDDGDLGPGRKIAVLNRTGGLEAEISFPARLTRIAVDGGAVFGLDVDSGLRIFRVDLK